MFPKPSPDHGSDDGADDGASHEIGEPMDGHGDSDTDIKRVEDCQQTQPALFGIQCEHRRRHGEGDGGMRRRPPPEDSTTQKTKVEDVADIGAGIVRGMSATRKRFVGNNNQGANEFSLSDGPTGQNRFGIFGKETEGKQKQWQIDGQ